MGFPFLRLLSLVGGGLVLRRIYQYLAFSVSIRGKLPRAPRSDASWWLGHEWHVFDSLWGSALLRYAVALGPVYRLKAAMFRQDIIVIGDNLGVKYIFDNAYYYVRSPFMNEIFLRVGGDSILCANAEDHRFQRRMVGPAFTLSALNKMTPHVLTSAESLITRVQAACNGKPTELDMYQYISPCAVEIIGKAGFGQDLGPESKESRDIIHAGHEDNLTLRAFPVFVGISILEFIPWIAKLPVTIPATVLKQIIQTRGEKMLKEPVEDDSVDMLSLLIRESRQPKAKGERKLEDARLIDNIVTFFGAGFDTTSTSTIMTLHCLAQHPRVQQKLRDELQSINLSDVPAIEALPYLDAVIREGLRLNPVARDPIKVALRDDLIPLRVPITLQNGNVIKELPIKAGDVIQIPYLALNMNPHAWGPDAAEFRPERWIDGSLPPKENLPHGPYASIMNFTDGPRACIGWHLAIREMKVVIAHLLMSFEIQDTGAKVERYGGQSMTPCVGDKNSYVPVRFVPL
ncbi:cytochrome P450 [Flagelloscypha sp. PMI_526]|nr:cytochrome P450 [Flagelloscypha sp. PMI_526]